MDLQFAILIISKRTKPKLPTDMSSENCGTLECVACSRIHQIVGPNSRDYMMTQPKNTKF